MANRRISEFPELDGADIDEQDLLTLVHIFEVDPTLRNKKITFTQFRNYLDQYYAALDGVNLIGNVTITGSLAVNTTFSGNVVEVTGLTQLNTVTASGLANFSGIVVQNNAIVSGTVSGALVTGNTVQASNLNAVSGVFTSQVSGTTVTGNTGLFTDITGSTLHITTPSGATAALVCSGVVSGDANGFVIQGPLIILA